MSRAIAIGWHAASFILAGCLYFFFVLPRWLELDGGITPVWATVLRILTGAVLALTALPVLLVLRKTRRPEFGTPELANRLRTWSVIGHLLAAALIVGTAVVEIWVSIDRAGTWLFAVYGAAAAIALLSAIAFYLAYLAELPPPAPKPLKAKKVKTVDTTPETDPVPDDTADDDVTVADTVEADETVDADETDEAEDGPGLRNRRPQKSDVTS